MNLERRLSQRRAVVMLEATVSIMLIGTVLGAVSLLMVRYSQSVDYFLNYRRVQLAAESCIERLRAGELPLADAIMNDPGGVQCEITMDDGTDIWKGLHRVQVTARVTGKHGRVASFRLVTYVSAQRAGQGGES
ncbi:MAG: hypothetical protein IH987_14215 [Planctomycetes bacterium]|nr:hypothetical protein [Planctomycetota bacterium]